MHRQLVFLSVDVDIVIDSIRAQIGGPMLPRGSDYLILIAVLEYLSMSMEFWGLEVT